MNKNKFLYMLLGVSLLLPVFGCGKRPANYVPKNLQKQTHVVTRSAVTKTNNKKVKKEASIELYLINNNQLTTKSVKIDDLNGENIIKQLQSNELISEDINLKGDAQKTTNNLKQTILMLNFDDSFKSYLDNQNDSDLFIHAIANTFIKAYNVDAINFTVNGNSITTVSGNYDFVEFYDLNDVPIDYGKIASDFDYIESLKDKAGNLQYSPMLVDSDLILLAKSMSEDNIGTITKDTNTSYLNDIYKQNDDNIKIANELYFNSSLNKTINQDKSKSLSELKVNINGLDYTNKKDTINQINNYINTFVEAKNIKAITNIENKDNLYLSSNLNFKVKWKSGFDPALIQKKMTVANLAGESKTVDLLYNVEQLNYFADDTASGFIKDMTNGYKFMAILPNTRIKKLANIDIQKLIDSAEPHSVAISIPRIDVCSNSNISNLLSSKYEYILKSDCNYNSLFDNYTNPIGIDKVSNTVKFVLSTDGEEINAPDTTTEQMVTLDRPFYYLILDKNNNVVIIGHYIYI